MYMIISSNFNTPNLTSNNDIQDSQTYNKGMTQLGVNRGLDILHVYDLWMMNAC